MTQPYSEAVERGGIALFGYGGTAEWAESAWLALPEQTRNDYRAMAQAVLTAAGANESGFKVVDAPDGEKSIVHAPAGESQGELERKQWDREVGEKLRLEAENQRLTKEVERLREALNEILSANRNEMRFIAQTALSSPTNRKDAESGGATR